MLSASASSTRTAAPARPSSPCASAQIISVTPISGARAYAVATKFDQLSEPFLSMQACQSKGSAAASIGSVM